MKHWLTTRVDVEQNKVTSLPKGFKFELTFDERNCLVTNHVGLYPDEQLRIAEDPNGWKRIREWTERMGSDMIAALRNTYEFPPYHDLIVMSDQQKMHTLEVWVKSRRPLPSGFVLKVKKPKMDAIASKHTSTYIDI